MIRVIMKTTKAGPDGNAQPGSTITVTDQEAAELVNGGYAEYVPAPSAAPQAETPEREPVVETTAITPETTAETEVVKPVRRQSTRR